MYIKSLPKTENPLVARTDFSDQSTWEKICAAVREPYGDLGASVEFIDDIAYRGMAKEHVLHLGPDRYAHSFIILVDRPAILVPGFPLLVVDLSDEPGREFRTIPSEVYGIEANLTLANMSFSEFADNVDEDGVFRGFPRLSLRSIWPGR
jgi:hypothetical protein